MADEIRNLPERPIDQLRRHETELQLLREDANEHNNAYGKLADELRELRIKYESNERFWKLTWQLGRVALRLLGWGGAAAIGWGGTHWDKVEAFIHPPEPK